MVLERGGYDSNMSYPPQGQPVDPGSQPQPPGGYVPGQTGPAYPQQYTQPSPSGGYQQPGYGPPPQQPYVDPYQQQYGQYGPPPVQPTSKSGASTVILIVIVLVLMIGGGAAGYFLLSGDDEGTTTADDSTTGEEDPTTEGGEEPTEDDGEDPPPSTDGLVVSSLGANTPIPASGDWQPLLGPGGSGRIGEDANGYSVDHGNDWISYMEVGVASGVVMDYDPADLVASGDDAMDYWTVDSGAFSSTEETRVSTTEFTQTEVDGLPAVLAEARVSWNASSSTEDEYEDVAILLVDVDGVNGFIGIASVPESGTDFYQATVDALLATTFGGEGADV